MESASCGATSALQTLSKHAQRDTSLQHSQSRHGQIGSNPVHSFRSFNVDPLLNSDFQRFDQGHDISAGTFMNDVRLQRPEVHTPLQGQRQGNQAGWVNDFSNLSINQQPQQQHPVQIKNDWQQQFMQQRQQQVQHQSQTATSTNISQVMPSYANGSYNYSMNMAQSRPIYAQQSEHQEVHKLEQQQQQFENEFDMIEKEIMAHEKLNSQIPQEDAVQIEIADSNSSMDKEQFAQTARKVQTAMMSSNSQDEEMQNKLNNSNFLKLMNSIGNRNVELEGDKLVDVASGQDVRDKDPETLGRPPIDKHFFVHKPMHDAGFSEEFQQLPQQQSSNFEDPAHQNKLPDPLAHIKDGQLSDINDPLTAARIISGGQVQTADWMDDDSWLDQTEPAPARNINDRWQESYDDYRHDDDMF
ncbi:hypothetical protein JA1_000115 [Spathaspora sp. JA1]|nr:hypothetical protein JA1_000115 [Spathaspora sp. JA1]